MKKSGEKKVAVEKATDKKVTAKKNKHYVAEKKVVKQKKENIFKRIGKYFKGVGKEFQRIRWTSGKDLVKYSLCTLGFVVFFGLYFYGIDWISILVRKLAN